MGGNAPRPGAKSLHRLTIMNPAKRLPNEEGEYQCSLCREWKPSWDYHKSTARSHGLHYACKPCARPINKRRKLLKRYGLTLEEFELRLVYQNGKCACCGREMLLEGKRTRLVCVDHNHDTGEIRDLLCGRCNLAAGNVKDSSELAEKLRKYLAKWGR